MTELMLSTNDLERHLTEWNRRITADGQSEIIMLPYMHQEVTDDAVDVVNSFTTKPNIRTARAFLRHYNIPIPNIPFLIPLDQEIDVPAQTTKRRRFGGSPQAKKDLYALFVKLDALHDLNEYESKTHLLRKRTAELVLKNEDVVDSVSREFISNKTGFTRVVATKMMSLANVSMQSAVYTPPKADSIELNNYTLLYNEMLKWQSDEELNIVIDCVVAFETITANQFLKTLFQCAIILLLFANVEQIKDAAKSISRPKRNSNVKTINLLDGEFNELDNLPLTSFMSRFILRIKRITRIKGNVNLLKITTRPQFYEKYYKLIIYTHDDKYVQAKIGEYTFTSKREDTKHNAPPDLFPKEKVDTFDTKSVKSINTNNISTLYAWPNHTDHADYFNAIIDINVLRDAWRADAAVANGGVFITSDRLSFIYYCMLCKWEGKMRRGFYFNPTQESVSVAV